MQEHLEVEPAPVEGGCRHIIGPAAEQGQEQPADISATRVAECAGRDRATLWLVLGVIVIELAWSGRGRRFSGSCTGWDGRRFTPRFVARADGSKDKAGP